MAKIRLEVSKLENATADYISLVPRGANRIPFRIIKQHQGDDMINIGGKLDLGDIRNVLKSEGAPAKKDEQPAPQVAALAGIVMEKGDHLTEEVLADLTAAGIDMSNPVENDDGTVTFVQDGAADEVTVVKMSGDMLALVSGLDVESVVKGTQFEAIYKEGGFLLSPDDAMQGTAENTKKSLVEATAENTSAVREQNRKLAEDAAHYAQTIIDLLPAAIFKADAIVAEACQEKKRKAQEVLDATRKAEEELAAKVDCPACDGVACNICDTGKVTKEEAEQISKAFPFKKKKPVAAAPAAEAPAAEAAPAAKPAEAAPAPAAEAAPADAVPAGVDAAAWAKMTPEEKAAVRAAATQKADQVAAPAATVQGMDTATLQKALADALAPIQKGLTDLAVTVDTVQKAQEAQAAEVTSVKAKVTKAEALLKGTVIGGVPEGDREDVVAKKDSGTVFDTAYQPRIRKVQKGFVGRLQDERRSLR